MDTTVPDAGPAKGKNLQSTPPIETVLARGVSVGRYVILDRLGSGGMGVVYTAYDPELNRKVALKLLRARSSNPAVEEERRSRLQREAQALARLSHPNVISVHDVGSYQGQLFIAMELVEGNTLRGWLMEKQRDWQQVLEVFRAAGRGLAAAHAAGLVHRDFKPGNVLIGDDGRVRVMDFGLARVANAPAEPRNDQAEQAIREHLRQQQKLEKPPSGETDALSTALTQSGVLIGTPGYMSPEQLGMAPTDGRSDQFSFCVALYEALYLEHPFGEAQGKQLIDNVLAGQVIEAPAGTKVPAWVRKILLRGLSVSPDQRFPSMDALLAALDKDPWRRRRRWLRLGGAVALAVIGLLLPQYQRLREERRCRGVEQQLTGIWDEPQKRLIRQAILASGAAYAQDTWREVERALDAYTRDWTTRETEVCLGTRAEDRSPALREGAQACLSRRLADVGALSHLLGKADAEIVERAVSAAHGLSSIQGCAGQAVLAEQPRHGSGAQDPRTQQLWGKLGEAAALKDAGKYAEGLKVGAAALALARELGDRSGEAEALYVRGSLYHYSSDYPAAERELSEAGWTALAAGRQALAVKSWIQLVQDVGERQARPAEGYRWARFASSAIEGMGGSEELTALLESSIGVLNFVSGQRAEALKHLELALSLKQKALPPEHPQLAAAMSDLALVLADQGRLDEAVAYHRKALAIRERKLGPEHPQVATSLNNLGSALRELGHADEAVELHRRALAIRERSLGPEHPEVAVSLNNLASALASRGDHAEALERYQRALALKLKALGPNHHSVAAPLNNVGNEMERLRRYDEALGYYRRSLAVLERALGKDNVKLARPLENIGNVLIVQGKYPAALAEYKRALALRQVSQGADSPDLARDLIGIGNIQLAERMPALALSSFERALELRQKAPTRKAELAEAHFAVAKALWETKSGRDRAQALARKARDIYAELGDDTRPELEEVDAWRAARKLE